MKPKTNERITHVHRMVSTELGAAKADKLLRNVGLDSSELAQATVTAAQEANLIRAAARELDDISFGARTGLAFRHASTLTAYIARSSASLRDALVNGPRFYGLTDGATGLSLREVNGADAIEVLTLDGSLLRYHRFQEFRVFALLARLRTIAGKDLQPLRLVFQHEIGPDAKALESVAGCAIEFGGAFDGLVFKPGTLDVPLTTHDPELVAYLSDLAQERMERSGRSQMPLRAQVEQRLISKLPARLLTSDEVAADMGLSRRTLNRKLKAEGLSFRDIVDALRFDLAKTYLKDGLSITETAYLLGYGDHAAFSTAFKRWAGVSPSQFE